jgi:CheY-like chemotaxis protein
VYTSIKAPLLDGSPAPSSVVTVSTDTTERKRLEDALREADRLKDEFLATLAHELRNPLAPVRYAVHVLHQKSPDIPELRWAREVIERQIQHMARLIEDLLDVNRITRNKLELRLERVELDSVISAAVEASRPLIERDGHQLSVELSHEPLILNADVTRLAQVFSNLLNNATKYSEPGGRITLSTERKDGQVAVTIADTGVGIAPDVLPRIFDMFTQVGRSLEQSEGGLGIGLALAKRLVQLHGGIIEARSEGLGKGSEFTVLLNLAPEGSAAKHIPAVVEPPERSSARRILVAEDNDDAAEMLEVMMQMMGHEVKVVRDGLEALDAAAEFKPQVMLLDIGMPKLNGYDTARRVRQQQWGKNITLIALTGWGQEKDKQLAHEAGFDIHLVKPIDPKILQELLTSPDQLRRPIPS